MKKNTGYREMLRDRCPKLVDYALKWCKSKETWLDHVYKNFIWIYVDNEARLKATKITLGINTKHNKFKFEDTIAWDNLTKKETEAWKRVAGWVSWFQKTYSYVENTYVISKQAGKDITDIKLEIMTKYLKDMCPTKDDDDDVKAKKNKTINEFVDYLITCFENNI